MHLTRRVILQRGRNEFEGGLFFRVFVKKELFTPLLFASVISVLL